MTPPAVSVILVASSDFLHIQKSVRHLQAQTRAAEIQLVIATPAKTNLQCAPETWTPFHSVQFIEVGPILSASAAKVRAFEQCHAPIVAFTEDHVFTCPNWADVLIRAHADSHAAVGMEMTNANPSPIARADMVMSFGRWVAPAVRGIMPMLPGHNTSYKREVLVGYGARLEALLDSEVALHADLKRRNKTLFLETRSSIAHLNIAEWSVFLKHKFLGGRIFGARRSQELGWDKKRRALYVLGAPLIPILRLRRMLPEMGRTRTHLPFSLAFWAALAAGLICHATGEAVGYLFGSGDTISAYTPIELHRAEQLRREDYHLAFE